MSDDTRKLPAGDGHGEQDLSRREFLKETARQVAVCTAGVTLFSLFAESAEAACEYYIGAVVEVKGDDAVVTKVVEPAASAGVRTGDVVLHWGDDSAACVDDYGRRGYKFPLVVLRNGERLTFNITPAAMPREEKRCGTCTTCTRCMQCVVCLTCKSCMMSNRCTSGGMRW